MKNFPIISDMSLQTNYRFSIIDESVLAGLILARKGVSETVENIKRLVKIMREDSSDIADMILDTVASYNGIGFRVVETHNKIPNVLRYELAKLISWQAVTPTFIANYLALGNGIVAPADTDTTLGAELVRGTFNQRSSLLNTAYLDKFFWSSEVGWLTILEAGSFVDGTATANSGYLLSRAPVNIVIWATETLTINVSISLTSAT